MTQDSKHDTSGYTRGYTTHITQEVEDVYLLASRFYDFVDVETGWIHHWKQDHPKYNGAFPDEPFVSGVIFSGLKMLGYDGPFLKNHERLSAFKHPGIPGGLIRDPFMTGPDRLRMWNRDQWEPNLWEHGKSPEYESWRRYARFRPRHWLLWNHGQFHDAVRGDGKRGQLGEWAEKVRIDWLNEEDHDSVMHVTYRLAWLILEGTPTDATFENWIRLAKTAQIKKSFQIFFTRSIPNDPPGDHPPGHLVWFRVIDKVWEEVAAWRAAA